ncbi:MAG: transcription elongation factor GreA [Nitrospinaceae bacterium]|jgi:transcription elongation factor GreA|nr:transcription elongation factor GreA [Nitrospinota bacterium]MDP7148483.1 transcription elongation factor GreA [Nitrospinaceae bacterium]MDP7557014.1 transcription elongation factor GreA [Nitrospinaceae bacterium]|tara:strand:- start:1322 stop:1807 length:486 start_codon:yes stop_codon:yes gene_type:complete
MKQTILKKLDKQLADSQKELQVDIPEALKIAREHGDLSENAEYKAAKERQTFLQARISLLQKRISDVTSLDLDRIPKDRSGLGSTLLLNDLDTGEGKKYRLVFPEDVDPDVGKISAASPIGRALMGKQEGDEIVIPLPDQKVEYEVIRVTTIHDDSGEDEE